MRCSPFLLRGHGCSYPSLPAGLESVAVLMLVCPYSCSDGVTVRVGGRGEERQDVKNV